MKTKILIGLIVVGLSIFILTSCSNSYNNKTSEKELELQKKELDLKQKELELKEKQLLIDSAKNVNQQNQTLVSPKQTETIKQINLPLKTTDIKEQIAKQLLIDDEDVKTNCLNKIDKIKKEIDIESISLNKNGEQYLVSANAGYCGSSMNSPCVIQWVYEYINNHFRFLGSLDCSRGTAKATKVRTNGYYDILRSDFYGGSSHTFRYKYNGNVYKQTGEE